MKKITVISAMMLSVAVAFIGCDSHKEPGKVYMPDMGYSRAYESYAARDSAVFTMDASKSGGNMIFFNNMPVKGTIKRGEMAAYAMLSDTTGTYATSAAVKNPYDSLPKAAMDEAGRLFNINCAICHGAKGEGNGPIADKIGSVANLTGAAYVQMAEGTMFHSVTYGKGLMGSYASQLSREQRWMIVKYIKAKIQPKPAVAAATTAVADTAKKKP